MLQGGIYKCFIGRFEKIILIKIVLSHSVFWMLYTYYITVSIFIYPYVFEWLLKLWFEYVLFCGIIVNSTLLFLFTAADERVKSVNALYTYVNIFLNIENSAFDHIHVVK